MRRTAIVNAGTRRLRVTVTVEILPEPLDTTGVEIPGPPALPRELHPTVRPALRVVPEPRKKVA